MSKVKVRGIYSTALTKLLLENGFKIAQPSIEIINRLNIEPNEESFDAEVRDRLDRNGVRDPGEKVDDSGPTPGFIIQET
ncbi:MAG: hypothetical protein QXF61_06570, partial [Nitrososphaeria archaeon]